jgi:hypothetical protein
MTTNSELTLSAVEQVQAVEAIIRVKSRYAYTIDHGDWDGFVSLFAPDAQLDESDFPLARKPGTNEPASSVAFEYLQAMATAGTEWPIVGPEAIRASVSKTRPGHVMVHHICNPDIELTSDSTATAVFRFESHHWLPVGEPVAYMHNFGSYHETYCRLDDGQWYIKTVKLARLRVECS